MSILKVDTISNLAETQSFNILDIVTAMNAMTALEAEFDALANPITPFAKTLLDDANASTARGTLGAAASGANTDITSLNSPSLGAATATTAAANDNSTKVATTAYYVGQAGTTAPQSNGAATVGTSLKFAREDHVHSGVTTGTFVPTLSGNSVDFLSIPNWVKKITISFINISNNSGGSIIVKLGTSTGVVSSGYTSSNSNGNGGVTTSVYTDCFSAIRSVNPGERCSGHMTLTNISENAWVSSSMIGEVTGSGGFNVGAGNVNLSNTLTRLQIFTSGTFISGGVNVMYE